MLKKFKSTDEYLVDKKVKIELDDADINCRINSCSEFQINITLNCTALSFNVNKKEINDIIIIEKQS